MDTDVLVIGSINQDKSVAVRQIPRPGETVLAHGSRISGGGKGANQAVAAAQVGVRVALIGAVGDDAAGTGQREDLDAFGVDTSMVKTIVGVSTGTAFITVSPEGENSIVVDPGANRYVQLNPEEEWLSSAVVLTQGETPYSAVLSAASLAVRLGARHIHNAAPAPSSVREVPTNCDPLVVNVHEARTILGDAFEDALRAVESLRILTNSRSCVVTLGDQGSVVAVEGESAYKVSAVEAAVVLDTTGAGDCFVGSLAGYLSLEYPMEIALMKAGVDAARNVASRGARKLNPKVNI